MRIHLMSERSNLDTKWYIKAVLLSLYKLN